MRMRLTLQSLRQTGSSAAGGPVLGNPVLTQTSTAGTNPPTWDSVMPNLLDGDTIQLDFTTNGANPDGTAEESHTVLSTDETITWGTFTGFAGGTTIKWRERYGRDTGSGFVWSNWSNTLSDVMSGAAWSPTNLFTTEYGFALDPSDLTKLFQSNAGTTAVASAGDVVGYIADLTSNAHHFKSAADDTTRPTYQTTGGAHILFDGSNDALFTTAAGLYAAGVATIIMAVKNNDTTQNDKALLCERSSSSNNPDYTPATRVDPTTDMNYQYVIRNDANATVLSTSSSSGSWADGNWDVMYIEDTGSNIKVTRFTGGTQVNNGAGQNYTRSGTLTMNRTSIGAVISLINGRWGNLRVGRVIAISRLLTGSYGTTGDEKDYAVRWVATPQTISLP